MAEWSVLVYSEAVECTTSAESVSVGNPYRCLTWQLSTPKATFFLNALSNSAEKEVYTEKTKQNKTKQNISSTTASRAQCSYW